MAVTVSDRIQSAIEDMDNGKYDHALSEVCIAIDITSQKYYHLDKSSNSYYKKFVSDNIWIILTTGIGGIISPQLKVPFSHKDINSDSNGYCTFEQIVYHVMRCGFIHGTGEDSNIQWNNKVNIAVDANNNLQINPAFIWGFMLAVIVCPVNACEHISDTAWIASSGFKYLVNDLWGKIDSMHNIFKASYGVDFQKRPE